MAPSWRRAGGDDASSRGGRAARRRARAPRRRTGAGATHRHRVADRAEVEPLCQVLPGRAFAAIVFFGHEGVAHVHDEVGMIGALFGEGLEINVGAGV